MKKAITGKEIIENFVGSEDRLYCPRCFKELQEFVDEEILVCPNLSCSNSAEYKPNGDLFFRKFKKIINKKW